MRNVSRVPIATLIEPFEPTGQFPDLLNRTSQGLVHVYNLITGLGKPQCRAFFSVQNDVGGARTDLSPGVEDPGRAEQIRPGAILAKRGLMNVTGKHDIRFVLTNPTTQSRVPIMLFPVPTRRRCVWRGMVDPDPSILRFL